MFIKGMNIPLPYTFRKRWLGKVWLIFLLFLGWCVSSAVLFGLYSQGSLTIGWMIGVITLVIIYSAVIIERIFCKFILYEEYVCYHALFSRTKQIWYKDIQKTASGLNRGGISVGEVRLFQLGSGRSNEVIISTMVFDNLDWAIFLMCLKEKNPDIELDAFDKRLIDDFLNSALRRIQSQ